MPQNNRHRLSASIISSRSILFQSSASISSINTDGISTGSTSLSPTISAVLNLTVSIAGGVGMVTLPGSFAAVGWMEGIALLFVSGVCAGASLFLLNRLTRYYHDIHPSYAGLVANVLGKVGSDVLEMLTLAYCLGQIVAYLGAVGGQVVFLLDVVGWSVSLADAIFYSAGFAMVPLSLLPEESAMRSAGALGTVCMVYIVLAIAFGDGGSALENGFCSAAMPTTDGTTNAMTHTQMKAFSSSITTMLKNAPIFLFSMNASVTYVPIRHHHNELLRYYYPKTTTKNDTSAAIAAATTTVIMAPLLLAGLFYLSCSLMAYAVYCDTVPENVVDAFPISYIPGLFARAFLALELLVAGGGIYIPLGRAALWHLLHGPDATLAHTGGQVTRVTVTVGLVTAAAVGSVALDGALALPLAVTSALCVTAQMFVLPGLCVATIMRRADSNLPIATVSGTDDKEEFGNAVSLVPGGDFIALGFALLGGIFGALSLAALFGIM